MEPQERVDYFKTAFAKANPPPSPGFVPVKPDDVLTDKSDIDDSYQANRWPCEGGPMAGFGIAKSIALKKGAGKKKLHITFRPSSTIKIRSEDMTTDGYYTFVEDKYVWTTYIEAVETLPDIWNNEYWAEQRKVTDE